MSEATRNAALQRIVNTYTERLGGSRPASVRIVPGAECHYNLFRHRIGIGEAVIRHASTATCRVIIAHEVGHSLQPELRAIRLKLWFSIALLVLAMALPAIGAALDILGPPAWIIGTATLSTLSMFVGSAADHPKAANQLEREFDADACSIKLVGQEETYNALIEYGELFAGGQETVQSRLRLSRIKHPVRYSAEPQYQGAAVSL